jgi:alkylation response protein AidB-like acyl-CoA dehydrogenase
MSPTLTDRLRHRDFSLTDEQRELRATFAQFFERECPTTRVRDAEPPGFDGELWSAATGLGVLTMGISEVEGGDGATVVDLALVAEEVGDALAPIPFVDGVVASRLLAAAGAHAHLGAMLAGTAFTTVALHPATPGAPQLVPSGGVADSVVGLDGDELVVVRAARPHPVPANLGSTPVAWWDLADADGRTVLASGAPARARWARAVSEWRLLTAATLVGITRGALALAVDYARDRVAFGVPIAMFQAISHPLADVATALEGARHLVWKAAWFAEHEPDAAGALVPMAFLHAVRTANQASSIGIHVQGGFGFTTESDRQLYFRRAQGWALPGGDPTSALGTVADALYGECAEPAPTTRR